MDVGEHPCQLWERDWGSVRPCPRVRVLVQSFDGLAGEAFTHLGGANFVSQFPVPYRLGPGDNILLIIDGWGRR